VEGQFQCISPTPLSLPLSLPPFSQGGYSDLYVPFCGHAIIEEMSGVKTEVKDCMLTDVNHWGYHELQVHQVGMEGGMEGGRERGEGLHADGC